MTVKRARGLGRGLDALLGVSGNIREAMTALPGMLKHLPVCHIRPGRYQPRIQIDNDTLTNLAASIKEQGLLQPILVRSMHTEMQSNENHYEIIAGERRYRAAQLVGLTQIPAIIKDVDDQSTAAIALVENIQRENLNPLEEAQGMARLIKDFSFTHEQVALSVGRSRSTVSNLLRLMHLATPVQNLLTSGSLNMGHARALLGVDHATQILLADEVVMKHLSVRETEKRVGHLVKEKITLVTPANENNKPLTQSQNILRLEDALSSLLAMQVQIKPTIKKLSASTKNKGGKLMIHFANFAQLDQLITQLQTMKNTAKPI